MKQIFILILGIFFLYAENIWSCTNFIAGKNATTDGSTIVTYNADSHTLYGELYHWPATEWPESSWLEVKEWDTGKPLGRIPQVAKTYAVVGNMNEYQVTIGETSFGGRTELVDTTAIIDYGSLIYIALQRSKTAREAIRVMTDLVEKYGYCSEGESFSIADPNEAWIMEMIGKGSDYKGAVWVAVRIPDDCVSGHANQSRIRQFPLDDPDNCLYSSDVISFARQKGYFNGTNTAFSFADAYAPADIETLRLCDARIWSFFLHVKSGMERYLAYIKGQSNESMPLYVKPDQKLSVQDFKSFMRDHFEGTEFDMNNDIGAGPFHVPYRWRPLEFIVDSVKYVNERATATQQTGFSFVAQMRNWLPNSIGGILWFGVDDANTNVYIPMYCGITEIPECFRVGNGDLLTFSWTSAFWIYNWVANMSYGKYNYMIKDIRPVQDSLENKFNKEVPSIDLKAKALYTNDPQAALKMITEYSCNQAQETTQRWKKLGEYLMVKYIDGNVKKEQNGVFKRNAWGLPESPDQPGYDQRYYRSIVNETGNKFRITKTIDDKK
jgi:dipeptidase